MPLNFIDEDKFYEVINIKGREDLRKKLEDMGFVKGIKLSLVAKMNGGIIVKVLDSRIAIDLSLASKIIVKEVI